MKVKRLMSVLLACAMLVCSIGVYAGAVGSEEDGAGVSIQRASGRFSMDIPADTLAKTNRTFSLKAGETITINASYSPSSASVDFGYLDPDGLFHYVTATGGSVNYTFEVEERGSYTLAIRNNSSRTVSVSGYVNY